MAAKQQKSAEASAIDVIWNTKLESSAERLVIYYLASKHQLAERVTSTYQTVSQFLNGMQDAWTSMRELQTATQLSTVKIQKTLEGLSERGLVKASQRPLYTGKPKVEGMDIGPQETIYDITDKMFADFTGGQMPAKTQKIA